MKKETVLFIGNYFKKSQSNPNVWEDLHLRLEENGWTILRVSKKPGRFVWLLDIVLTIIRKRNSYAFAEIDVFSGQAFIWAEIASYLLQLLAKPFLLTLHGGNLPKFAEKNPKRMQHLLTSSARVITPSLYLQNSLTHYRDDITVIPNSIPIENYNFQKRSKISPNLIWLRAFHEIYNPELAPKVLHKVLSHYPDARLYMIGPDKLDGSLEKTTAIAEKFNLIDHIEFVGQVNKKDVPFWLSKGDIFINTTNVDNTPVSIIEAMASGLCIVSTDVGGVRFLLDDGVDALLVSQNDSDSMAMCIVRVLQDSALAEGLSVNARKKAETFSLEKTIPLWENEFLQIIKNYG